MIFWGWHLGGVLNTFFPTLRSEGWWLSLLVKSQSWWSKASMQLWREGNYQPHCSFWEAATFSSKCSVGWCKPLSISKVLKTLIEIIFASIFIAFMKAKYFFFIFTVSEMILEFDFDKKCKIICSFLMVTHVSS